jgi:hypothetical protein
VGPQADRASGKWCTSRSEAVSDLSWEYQMPVWRLAKVEYPAKRVSAPPVEVREGLTWDES